MAPWVPAWLRNSIRFLGSPITGLQKPSNPVSPSPSAARQRGETECLVKKKRKRSVLGVRGSRVDKRRKKSTTKSTHSDATQSCTSGSEQATVRDKGLDQEGNTNDRNSDASVHSQHSSASHVVQTTLGDETTSGRRARRNAFELPVHVDRSDPRYADWTDAEILLFNMLQDRGCQPLLPASYQLDFPTLPDAVFTEAADVAFLRSRSGHELRAIRSLQSLFDVGARIRERLYQQLPAAHLLQRCINKYAAAVAADGPSLDPAVPRLLDVRATRIHETHLEVIARSRIAMAALAQEHRDYWALHRAAGRDSTSSPEAKESTRKEHTQEAEDMMPSDEAAPPVIFAIVIAGATMTFAALDAADLKANMKMVAIFDWALEGQDVWNALAVAILVTMAHNYQLALGSGHQETAAAASAAEESDPEDPDA